MKKIYSFVCRQAVWHTVAGVLGAGIIAFGLTGCGGVESAYKEQPIAENSINGTAESLEKEFDAENVYGDALEAENPDQEGMTSNVQDSEDYENSAEQSDAKAGELKPVTLEKDKTEEVRLIMVGDILLHTPVEKSAVQEDGTYDYSAIFSHTKRLIAEADVAIVNQEVIIGGEELGISGYPAFNAPKEVAQELVDTGFDVVCHGTNHALDKGAKGLKNCLTMWDECYPDIQVLGIHDSQDDADVISYLEVNGIKIAFLNYTYGTNGIPLPSDMPYAVDLLDADEVIADLREAEENADFTVVCPHWGTEYELGITAMQQKWADIFQHNGADLVIGTHPHVIEPVEMRPAKEYEVEGKNLDDMLVFYSLGNFVNWTSGTGPGTANRMVGGMAQVTIRRDENGKVVIDDYGVKALVSHVTSGVNGVTVYPLEEYSPELALENEIRSQDSTFDYEYCVSLCDDVWNDLWE